MIGKEAEVLAPYVRHDPGQSAWQRTEALRLASQRTPEAILRELSQPGSALDAAFAAERVLDLIPGVR